jgi:hypothetical protein
MTRFVVDCGAVLRLAEEGIEVPAEHELLAPTLLGSQTLSAMHEAVYAGEILSNVALDRLTRIWALPIRLLGDAVLRRRAFDLAEQLGWAETYDAAAPCTHPAAGRRVRDPGRGTGAPGGRDRPHGDDRGAANASSNPPVTLLRTAPRAAA